MENNFYILLDNGHGKDTPGKRSPLWDDGTQLFEYRYARDIVEGIKSSALLKSYKSIIPVIITPEEEDISLKERCRRVNDIAAACGKQNCLGISVHVNAFDGSASGWECHTYLGESLSDRYAQIIWSTFYVNLSSVFEMRASSTVSVDFDSNFAILRDTVCPFVLTENGFMDNEQECRFLLSDKGIHSIIDAHVLSIIKCYKYWKCCSFEEGFLRGEIDPTKSF